MSRDEDLKRALQQALAGSIREVEPVQEQPEAVLTEWQVYELGNGERHLVGWCPDAGEGRATSAVVDFDPKRRACRTASGRVYELRGPAGCNGDADYVWSRWRRINRVSVYVEVTEEWVLAMADRSGES